MLVTALLTLFVISVPFVGWAIEAGVALTASHLLAMAIVVLAADTWIRQRRPAPCDLVVISILTFFAIAAASVVVLRSGPDDVVVGESAHWKSVKQLAGLAFGIGLFLSVYALAGWHRLGLHLLRTHYWMTAGFGAATIVQYGFALSDMRSVWANFPVHNSTLGDVRLLSLMYGFPRVSLTLVEPSVLATYLLSGWAFWLFTLDRPPFATPRVIRLFRWSGLVLGAAVVLTGSRSAYGVSAALALAALALRPYRVRRAGLIAASLLAGLLLTGAQHTQALVASLIPSRAPTPAAAAPSSSAPVPGEQTFEPATATVEEDIESAVVGLDVSVQQRSASYLIAMRLLRERPLLGGGFGTSSFYMERYWPDTFIPLHDSRVAGPTMMSHYATIVSETGVLGLLAVTVFGAAVARRLWHLARRGPANQSLAFGLCGMLTSYAITALGAALVVYQILLIWLLLAVALTATDDSERPAGAGLTREPAGLPERSDAVA